MSIHKTDQVYYNKIKGSLSEINEADNFSSVTIDVGHENKRTVNVLCKKDKISIIKTNYKIGDEICIRFFVSSRFKHNRWYTNVNCLKIEK
tara:strand:+ start:4698 stop:4970 length:273 start_codon:yes stop_codon:yes gene_type:complete